MPIQYDLRENVRRHGRWDPTLDAYAVVDPETGDTRYYRWVQPTPIVDAAIGTVSLMFFVAIAALVYALFFRYPQGVAGDRSEQLAEYLKQEYRVTANWLPTTWSEGQVFTVDLEQDWDDPEYEAPIASYAKCKLQPGASAKDLSLTCRNYLGHFAPVSAGGADSRYDAQLKEFFKSLPDEGDEVRDVPSLDELDQEYALNNPPEQEVFP